MTTLPVEAIKRIADRRRHAEADLSTTLSRIPVSNDRAVYLPAWAAFATALLDSEADEFLEMCNTASDYRSCLAEVADRIIEGILPDRSLQKATSNRSPETDSLSIEQEIGSEAIWEVGEDGQRRPARPEIQAKYAKHGDWERFMPQHMSFFIRGRDNAPVREELRQVLQRRLLYWEGRFRPSVTTAEPTSPAVSEEAASGCVTSANATQAKGNISAELPSLPERVTRMLEIRWQGLLESYRLGGENVVQYASASESTRRIALQKPPDSRQRPHPKQWLHSYQRATRECGISSSVTLAEVRFSDLATEYMKLWSPSGRWERFADWLEILKVRVLGEIAVLWEKTDATKTWYETVCAPAVIVAVSVKVREFEGQARLRELAMLARAQGDELRAPDGSARAGTKLDGETGPAASGETGAKAKLVEDGDQKRLLTWDDIAICFLDPERVEVKVGDNAKHLHYAEMGFADRRGRAVGDGGPVVSWGWLKHLAKNRRVIEVAHRREPMVHKGPIDAERQPASQLQALSEQRASTVKARTALQAAVKDLRKRLRSYFPDIPGEPIVFEETQYRALFQVGTAEHFRD